jgi:hypothetical protein
VLSLWPADEPRLALALDATTLKKRFTVLAISVLYRGCAIPVARTGGRSRGKKGPGARIGWDCSALCTAACLPRGPCWSSPIAACMPHGCIHISARSAGIRSCGTISKGTSARWASRRFEAWQQPLPAKAVPGVDR